MSDRVRVCAVDDLAIGDALRVDIGPKAICLVRLADGFHAVDDTCTHEDYSLSEGDVDVDSCEIECWKHGSLFSLMTGEPQSLPATLPVAVHEISVENGDVFVVSAVEANR